MLCIRRALFAVDARANLFRYAHPEGYRSCYRIFYEEEIGVCPHILDLLSHEEYDGIFGYRKR